MKKILCTLIAVILTVSLCACSSGAGRTSAAQDLSVARASSGEAGSSAEPATNAAVITLKIGHENKPNHAFQKGLEKFKELVEERSSGQIAIEIYGSSTMGNNREMIEQCTLGSLDMVLCTNAPLGNFVPELSVFDLPFLFADRQTAYKVLDSDIGKELLQKLEAHNLVGLGFWDAGYRHVVNGKKDVIVPDDMKGMKIRTMENKIHLASFEAMGAIPTPMSWNEVFTALQQGTIDGLENAPLSLVTEAIYEVKDRISLTGHFYAPAVLLISKDVHDKLTPEQQQLIAECEQEARAYERDVHEQMDEEAITTLANNGMNVVEVDKALFREKCASVYEDFNKQYGSELMDGINAILNG